MTYSAEWPWESKEWKRHLKVFSQRFLRRWSGAGFIWKLEFQSRGAPHFHQFVWGVADSELRDFRHWISEVWNEIAGNGNPDHLLAGTSVERMRHSGTAIRYVGGYASKIDQTKPGEKVGRYWGVVGRNLIPWGVPQTVSLDERESKLILRTARRFMQAVNRQARIRRVGKLVGFSPSELVGCGGWFGRRALNYGKVFEGTRSQNASEATATEPSVDELFLDADFWATKIPILLKTIPPAHPRPPLQASA